MSLNLLCLECSDVGAEFGGEEPRVRRVQAAGCVQALWDVCLLSGYP